MRFLFQVIKLTLICSLLSIVFTTNLLAQNQTIKKTERKVRYITSINKDTPTSRPRILIIKRGNTQNKSKKLIRKLRRNDRSLEKKAFNLINEKRIEKGLKKVNWSNRLADLARQHSENMAKHTFFSHIGLNGRLIDQRAVDFGVNKWKAIGENIAYNKGFAKPADFAVERWMLSSTHRNNLLDSRWSESGVGVSITEDGIYYFTQVFLVR